MNNITVILLSGGKSTRFWPLSDKNTLSFLGKPLIKRQIENIKKAGFDNIHIVCNPENINLINSFHKTCILQEGEGIGAAVLSGLKKVSGPVIIINADDIFLSDLLIRAKNTIEKNPSNNFLTAVEVNSYFPGGYLLPEKNSVKEIVEKPGADKMPSNLFRFVFDYYSDSEKLKKNLEKLNDLEDYEKVINNLIKSGADFKLLLYRGEWTSLKYPWHVLDVTKILLQEIKNNKIDPSAVIDKTAKIIGPVIIDSGVKIFENAKIVGPCYIGKNVIVGNNAIIRESNIESDCVLGFSTDVARSYIGKNCWFHSNYIGDSVLDENIGMGAGANLANFRLDEEEIHSKVKGIKINSNKIKLGSIIGKNVRVGINASIMPGVKIGKDTFIGGGIVIEKDVPDIKFCFGETKIIFKQNLKKVLLNRDQFKKKI